jgi:hypothetical protein
VEVIPSEHFKRQVAAELDREGRPSEEQFDQQLAYVAELTFSAFWNDPTISPPQTTIQECASHSLARRARTCSRQASFMHDRSMTTHLK